MTREERELIRAGVIADCIEGSADFGVCTAKLKRQIPGQNFRELLAAVDRTWRREKMQRGQ